MARGKRDGRLEGRWRGLVARQAASGLSVRGFCRREHVTESAYYAWRRELRLRDRETPTRPAFVPMVLPQAQVRDEMPSILVELRGGRVLRLPPMLAANRVTELVRAVEAAS